MQEFHQSCDETIAWINEKDQALSSEDCGRDLAAVQMLQRRHQVRVMKKYERKITDNFTDTGTRAGTSRGENCQAWRDGNSCC